MCPSHNKVWVTDITHLLHWKNGFKTDAGVALSHEDVAEIWRFLRTVK